MADGEPPGSQLPSGRIRRAAKIGRGAAGAAARSGSVRLGRPGRTPEEREAALVAQQVRSAQAMVRMLGGMRGAAMKVGQMLSTVDLGLFSEEIRPQMQQILATLQQNAEPVAFADVRRVVEEDLGHPLKRAFRDVDPEPLAAASIGQVHRATLRDGRDVVLKVQYPGVAEAVHADLRNLRLGLKLVNVIAPGLDQATIAAEIRRRIADELDYELEAANQLAMARIYRGHPFIRVPEPVPELSRERVIVSEYVAGRRFAEIRDADVAARDRLGEILVRFHLNGPVRHGMLHGDPHPGNAIFCDDGRVALLDYGFFKHLSAREVEHLRATTRATYEQDAAKLLEVVVELGTLPPDPALAEPFLRSYTAIFGWLLTDTPLTADPAHTSDIIRHYQRMYRTDELGGFVLPADHLVLLRAVMLLIGVVGQLRSTNVWLDVVREWVLDDAAPATDLGREEQAFFATA